MLNATGAGTPAGLRCRCKCFPNSSPPPFLPGLLFYSGNFFLTCDVNLNKRYCKKYLTGLDERCVVAQQAFFFGEAGNRS